MGQAKYQNDGNPDTSGRGFALTLHEGSIQVPLGWKRPTLVFVNSMSDLFHPDVPVEFITRVLEVAERTPQHTYQVLTKRSQRLAKLDSSLSWPSNMWMGVSVENDRYAFRARHLTNTQAATKFLSCEPLIGPIPSLDLTGLDWVIVGGESGRRARRMDLDWVRELRDQCREAGVPLFVKQLGTVWSVEHGHGRSHGGDPSVWPTDLRIREMPTPSDERLAS